MLLVIVDAGESGRRAEEQTYYWTGKQITAGNKNPWRSGTRIYRLFCSTGNKFQVSWL